MWNIFFFSFRCFFFPLYGTRLPFGFRGRPLRRAPPFFFLIKGHPFSRPVQNIQPNPNELFFSCWMIYCLFLEHILSFSVCCVWRKKSSPPFNDLPFPSTSFLYRVLSPWQEDAFPRTAAAAFFSRGPGYFLKESPEFPPRSLLLNFPHRDSFMRVPSSLRPAPLSSPPGSRRGLPTPFSGFHYNPRASQPQPYFLGSFSAQGPMVFPFSARAVAVCLS